MDLQFYDNKFVITNLDYEMVQIILNGITCERRKLADKIGPRYNDPENWILTLKTNKKYTVYNSGLQGSGQKPSEPSALTVLDQGT